MGNRSPALFVAENHAIVVWPADGSFAHLCAAGNMRATPEAEKSPRCAGGFLFGKCGRFVRKALCANS